MAKKPDVDLPRKLALLGDDASPWLHDALSTIMATFSGENTSFVPLVALLHTLDLQAQKGDQAAGQILACVKQFSRLIAVAQLPIRTADVIDPRD